MRRAKYPSATRYVFAVWPTHVFVRDPNLEQLARLVGIGSDNGVIRRTFIVVELPMIERHVDRTQDKVKTQPLPTFSDLEINA